MKKKVKKILILGVGGPTPRSFVQSILQSVDEQSRQYEFYGVDCNKFAFGLYQKQYKKTFLIPKAIESGYWEEINKIIKNEGIDGAVVLPDLEVKEWSINAENKLEIPIKVFLKEPVLVDTLLSKVRLYKLLKNTDFIPKFCEVNTSSYQYETIIGHTSLPFWLRATEGSSGYGAFKIKDEIDLNSWIQINREIKTFIASEYLPNRNIGCILLFDNNHLVSTATFERVSYIMGKVAPSGITGNISHGKFLNEIEINNFSEKVLRFIAEKLKVKLNGPFTVDIKEDEAGNPKVTEINPRYIAPISCFAAAGANIPLDELNTLFSDVSKKETKFYKFQDGLTIFREVDFEPILIQDSHLYKL